MNAREPPAAPISCDSAARRTPRYVPEGDVPVAGLRAGHAEHPLAVDVAARLRRAPADAGHLAHDVPHPEAALVVLGPGHRGVARDLKGDRRTAGRIGAPVQADDRGTLVGELAGADPTGHRGGERRADEITRVGLPDQLARARVVQTSDLSGQAHEPAV